MSVFLWQDVLYPEACGRGSVSGGAFAAGSPPNRTHVLTEREGVGWLDMKGLWEKWALVLEKLRPREAKVMG